MGSGRSAYSIEGESIPARSSGFRAPVLTVDDTVRKLSAKGEHRSQTFVR